MKKALSLFLAILMVFALCACGKASAPAPAASQSPAEAPDASALPEEPAAEYDQVTITVSNFNPQASSYGQAMDAFKEFVEERSGGNVTVDVYHAGALGAEKECCEGVLDGSIDMMFSGTGGIGNFIPATAAVECWFVVENIGQLQEVIANLEPEFAPAFNDAGFEYLGCFFDGPRYLCSTKEITSISDLSGFKWRVPTSTIYVQSVEALGASAISMPLGEVYTSLQTGAIDALEGSLDSIVTYKYYEQAKYLVETAHVFQPLWIFYNKNNFSGLNEATQTLIREGIEYAESLQIDIWTANNATQKEFLESQGMTFVPLTDRDQWVTAVDEASYNYCKDCGDLGLVVYEAIKAVADK